MEIERSDYSLILSALKEKIRLAQQRAVLSVNTELLGIYWEIGRTIAEQEAEAGWGARVVDRLADDLRLEFPEMKGFSVRNLRYMREFYQAYPFSILQPVVAKLDGQDQQSSYFSENTNNQYDAILQPLVAKLPWSHHTLILTKAKNAEERAFYIEKCIENGWSKSVLEAQIDTALHKRLGKSLNNFAVTLPELQSELASATFKSPYIFDFLTMGEKMQERDLENALIQHLKKFLLELGKGFAFVSNQFRLKVEGDEYILDLLFYHVALHAYVLFELKLVDFEPEFAGKLNFYINAVDEQLKGLDDKPTIGVLLCKTPNATVVRYALNGINTPIGVSDFELAKTLPQQLKRNLPSIEDLEAEMDKEYAELKRPLDDKLSKVKAMMRNLKKQEVKEGRNPENVLQLFQQVLVPLRDGIKEALQEIAEDFNETIVAISVGGVNISSDGEALELLEKHMEAGTFNIDAELRGCTPAGVKSFDTLQTLRLRLDSNRYWFEVGDVPTKEILFESPYQKFPTPAEQAGITEKFVETILDDIAAKLESIGMETENG